MNGVNVEFVHVSLPVWEWDVFGEGLLVVTLTTNPPLWRRILTTLFLGSKWKNLKKDKSYNE